MKYTPSLTYSYRINYTICLFMILWMVMIPFANSNGSVTPRPLLPQNIHLECTIDSIAYSPTEPIMAIGLVNDWTIIWDLQNNKEIKRFYINNNGTLAFSPDGKTLASGGLKVIHFLDIETGSIRTFPVEPDRGIISLSFSPDGKSLATTAGNNNSNNMIGSIHIWDVKTGIPLQHFLLGEPSPSISFSPDGKSVVSTNGGSVVQIWDISTGSNRSFFEHTNIVNSVAFSPDGKSVASGGYDRSIYIWDLATDNARLFSGHTGQVSSVTFSPNGKYLLSTSGGSGDDDDTVRLWKVDTGTSLTIDLSSSMSPNYAIFSPDGESFAVFGQESINFYSTMLNQ